ncbi:MAG: IPT/TIG domain-containing protein [Planctomycetia bacterium]|nr:IPT/TIG domain-containing protein [Planctomycetia bacterium]
MKVSIRGNWSENDSVDLTEIVTLDDWETDDKSDDLLQQEDTPGTEQIHDHDEFSARMVDFAKGSISFIDHDTGVRTTVTLNSLVTESGNDIQDRSGPAPGSSNESDRSSWNLQTTITKTNTDGSAAAAPITRSENGSEAHHRINGVLGEPGNDNGSNTNPAAVVPSVSGIAAAGGSTARGSVEGGDVVRITGTGFTSDSQVWFDGTAAAESITISPTEIIAISPGHATGTVRVAVNNGAGTSAESEADKFDFATVDADHSSPNGGSSGSNGPDEGWFSGAWGRIKATAKRLDQFGGQINTFMLTGSWVDKEAASGLRNLKESLLGIGDGAIVFTDAISFGNIEATHREAVRAQQEAAFRGDFWSNAGFYSAKVGAKTIHAIVVVSGVAYVAGGVVYFVPGAAGTLTVAGNAAQPVILVLSADAAYNNGVAAYYDYQNGDLIDMTEHAAEGTVWAAFAGDSAKSSATLLKSIEFKPSNGRLVQEVWLHAEGKCGGASNLGPEKHAYAKKLLDRYQRMYGDRGLSTEVRYVNQQLWRPGMSTNHSVILDVVEGNLVKPKAVYDYKFGKKGLTDPRIAEIRRVCGFDEDIPIFLAP